MKVRIGTRKSQLALWQANYIANLINQIHGVEVELVKITTSGDKILDVPLAKIGGKGLFVKEIEDAMLKGEIDIAVHSLKDVPTQLPEGLDIIAITEREDPRDAFLSTKYKSLKDLPAGAVVGTSSLRRKSQIMKMRDDLIINDLRGNVDTRIRKLEEGQYDAIILAYAGLKRLGLDSKASYIFSPQEMIPAVCQGFLGIEARVDDERIKKILEPINNQESFIRATAERSFLKTLEGGCQVPLGAYCEIKDDFIHITGFIADLEGKTFIKESLSEKLTNINQAKELGQRLANILLKRGGKDILTKIYNL
ncbi:hydroxymethylbilane synthase [Sulfurihydrogenibium azorense]|uniref:Porphobilinogen deaminase n=1 Tax=Sulfurihydrogenibium azorense (strain DSM 15241 / OCM 825 / Az-Fu1) TaxID=204536 RepID=C1DTV2_SULAA|nr:hydroxymethylbilane synthase [Sulfurihydrogenibium azorense]ACN99692.1 porphobilinogen deaminase [Sulfurihydrogenibium azorense Az-Fu1]MDM7273027.1 hydroxymethylbilane synthase [Sulfurihydrogenibium azorense]